MLLSAKDFCKETGWPVKTIRRLCRTGQLECWRSGRVYLLDKEETLIRLELFKQQPCPGLVSDVPRQRRSKVIALPGTGFDGYASRTERMKAQLLGKTKKAASGANTGNL